MPIPSQFSQVLKRFVLRSALIITVLALALSVVPVNRVFADTAPATGTPSTVSADPLPTVQIESTGVVNAQVVVGNTVYATGEFTTARPAGAAEGVNTVKRSNLLAYDITTGNLITSFDHALNGAGKAITASPDGTKLYIGGKFTTVDGAAHPKLVEINLTNNTVVSTFTKGTNGTVATLAATNSIIYVGGDFTKDDSGKQTRSHLIAYTAAGALLPWAPNADRSVHAMTLTTGGTKLIVGGSFSTINGKSFHGTAALSPTSTGAPLAWASSASDFKIRNDNDNAGITSLSTDGTYIYLSAYNFSTSKVGGFEGTAALSPKTGAIVWANDCQGDTYDAFPMNGILYSTGHAHDCAAIGTFPQTYPNTFHAALAQTTVASGKNVTVPGNAGHYQDFAGTPKSTQLYWYPDIAKGTATGLSQAAWSITGNTDYIVFGGEFPSVNGVKQQGLVRFGKSTVSTNTSGPVAYSGNVTAAAPAAADGTTLVTWPQTYDRDNASLTYTLYRSGTTAPIATMTATSNFWALGTMAYKDSKLTAGKTYTYKVIVTDAYGNSTIGHSQTATGCHVANGTVNTLCVGEKLTANESLYSLDGNYRLVMKSNGTLVLYNSKKTAIWYQKTASDYAYTVLQSDGNLVIYNSTGKTALWNSKTAKKSVDHLTLKTNGNMALFTAANKAVWMTNTSGK